MLKRVAIGVVGVGVVACSAFWAGVAAGHSAHRPTRPVDFRPSWSPRASPRRGGILLGVPHQAGWTAVCRRVRPQTPFGTIYSTKSRRNRRPESAGGHWRPSPARCMRVSPARIASFPRIPYDHFTKVSDDDVKALYAYLMTRPPVSGRDPPNTIPFPLNIRALQEGWKLLFFRSGRISRTPPRAPNGIAAPTWPKGSAIAAAVTRRATSRRRKDQ